MTDPRFTSPDGWTPTPLQLSVPPNQRGIPWAQWLRRQKLCDDAELRAWLAANGAGVVKSKVVGKKKRQ
jgi:hypothetical protein